MLRDLHTHARAYCKLAEGQEVLPSAVPTVGTGFSDRQSKREGGGGLLQPPIVDFVPPTAGVGDSIAGDVFAHLESLFTNAAARRSARDHFVVHGVRKLLGMGCCVKAISCILCSGNQYLYHTPLATEANPGASRMRRAGAYDTADEGGGRDCDVPRLVPVEDLASLDCETNDACACTVPTKCEHRPFTPVKLLGDRVRFAAASHRGATLAQRLLIIDYVWDSSTCRPSRISLHWLADLLNVDVSRLAAVQGACVSAARAGDVSLASVRQFRTRVRVLQAARVAACSSAVAETLEALTRGEPDGKAVARWISTAYNSERRAYIYHKSVLGADACSRAKFRKDAKAWLPLKGLRCFGSVAPDHNMCLMCTLLEAAQRGCAIDAAACKTVEDGRTRACCVPGALLPAACKPADLDPGDAGRARALLLGLEERARAALKAHHARDFALRGFVSDTVGPKS